MHNPQSTSILEHALQIATLARSLVEAIQRRDRDLASQVRRAVSSIALNAAEAQGNAGGNTRVRLESALGSLYESQAGIRLAIAWGVFFAGCSLRNARVFELLGRAHLWVNPEVVLSWSTQFR